MAFVSFSFLLIEHVSGADFGNSQLIVSCYFILNGGLWLMDNSVLFRAALACYGILLGSCRGVVRQAQELPEAESEK